MELGLTHRTCRTFMSVKWSDHIAVTPSGDTGWNKHQSRSLNHSHLTSLNERWSVLPLTSAAEQSDPNSACSSRPFTMKWMIFVVIPEPGGSWPAPQRILRPLDSDSFSLWRTTCSWQTARPFSHLTIIQDNLLNQHTRAAKSQIQTDFKLYYSFHIFQHNGSWTGWRRERWRSSSD